MGAAGDMLMAALYELLDDKPAFLDAMRALGLPGIEITAEPAVKCGITGTHMKVLVHGEEELDALHEQEHGHGHEHTHHHTGLHDIEHLLSHLDLPQAVQTDALAVYRLIAGAESKVHGNHRRSDSFPRGRHAGRSGRRGRRVPSHASSLCGESFLLNVHVGCGQVRCAHGILPVPAPATALLLEGVPIYGGAVSGELCTPTGAALLRHFVTEFGAMPAMRLSKTSYGMGTKDFPAANCVRAMLGETNAPAQEILELSCNLDDCTGESLGFAMERLFDAGALDVYWTSVGMKKNRPAVLLTCMCRPEDREKMVALLFRHTTTLGVREAVFRRYTLARESRTVPTPDGSVRIKVSSGYGVRREKAEFEDLAEIARKTGKSLAEIQKDIL